jgi:cell division protein FtsI/penicillin-binding protein 2
MKVLIAFFLIILAFNSFAAKEIKNKSTKSVVQIDAIDFKIFDRQKNVFVENGKQSDPYGMQNDLFVQLIM